MASDHGGRRFSDEEFALILRTASEMGEGPDPAPPQQGLTLPEIQEIAEEVGIDPVRVSRAAALLPSGEVEALNRLLGGSVKYRFEHTIPGTVPTEELSRVMDVARRIMNTQGEAREVLGAIQWQGGTGASSLRVSLDPKEGATNLQVSVDRTEAALGVFGGFGVPATGIIGLALCKLVYGESDVAIIAGILSGLAPSLLFARILWKRSTKKWRERLLRMVDAMTREAEASIPDVGEGEGDQSPPLPGPTDLD